MRHGGVADPEGPGSTDEETDEEFVSDLIDLAGVTMDDVAALPDSVLAAALRRVRGAAAEGAEPFTNEYEDASDSQPSS